MQWEYRLSEMKLITFSLFFLFFHIFLIPAFAKEAPLLPMIVEGRIIINGKLAPAGTLITANIDGTTRAHYTLLEEGNYLLTIPGNRTDEGKIIFFYVNGINTNKTLRWKSGNITENFDIVLSTKAANNILPLFVLLGIGGVCCGGFLYCKELKFKRKEGRKK